MAEVRFTRQAEADLSEIASYTEETWGVLQADRYIDKLQIFCTLLARTPSMGRIVSRRGKKHFQPSLRRIEVGSHVVFYKPTTEGIAILRVLHGRMKFSKRDFDET